MLDIKEKPIEIEPYWLTDDQIEQIGDRMQTLLFSRAERRILRKRKAVPPSVWAERYRHLPRDAALPGPWKNATVAYAAGIMDASFFPSVQETIVCAAPQTAKTEINYTCLGFAIDMRPGNALIVFPDEDQAKDNCADRIQPMIEDSPRLRQYFTGRQDDVAAKKIKLQNALIYMAWANSPSKLSNKPLPYVILDEEDKYPPTASKKEASPSDLAKKRTRTFGHMRKIWRTSSPTIETGPIWKALTKECQVVFDYWVRCPKCGGYQKMIFENIKWPEDLREPMRMKSEQSAWYECGQCNEKWDDADRDMAVRAGEWRDREKGRSLLAALNSIRPVTIGFHIPSWLSPFVKLWEVAHAFLEGLRDINKMKDFRNSHAAEPWLQRVVTTDLSDVLKARTDLPEQNVPLAAVALTAGIDMQKYGFWFVVRAWARDYTSWLVHYGHLATWEDLEILLFDTWYPVHGAENGLKMRIYRAGLDTGGTDTGRGITMTEEAYMWLRRNGRGRGCRVWGTKGASRPLAGKVHVGKPLDKTPAGKPIPGGLQIIQLNTDQIKDMIHYRINQALEGGTNAAFLHKDTGNDWVRQVVESEEKQLDEKGRESWVRKHTDNHLLDCEGICQACADPEWPGGGIHLISEPSRSKPAESKPAGSNWIHNEQRPSRPSWLDNR
jgi:phage terminase large subunit GpA-like protein